MLQLNLRLRFSIAVPAAALLLSATTPLWAQSPPLGEVARKEQERRKALPASTKVYTNKDLPASAVKPAEAAAPAKPAEPSSAIPVEGQPTPAGGGPAGGEQPAAKNDEAVWRKRMSDAREELRRNEMFAQALETRFNSLTNDVISRDDPAQRARLAADRKDVQNELGRVRQEIEQGKKAIADIEEEARKAGVPPGWLR
jgi:archaellum component FlaC